MVDITLSWQVNNESFVSTVVVCEPSKLETGVRFPDVAFLFFSLI